MSPPSSKTPPVVETPPPPPPPDTTAYFPPAPPPAPASGMKMMMPKLPWTSLEFLAKAGGFLLIFIGTLVAVLFVSIPASCVGTGGCGTGTLQGLLNAFIAARVLWTIGVFGIGAGAGLKLLQINQAAESGSVPEDKMPWLMRQRRSNGVLFILSLLLFAFLLWTVTAIPGTFTLDLPSFLAVA
ncbi:MAG: hypothetical protein WAN77_04555 [Thermoplasmata archaeon]